MRLEHDQQPSRMRPEGRERRRDLVRVMGEIVDHPYSSGLADRLEPPSQALKPRQRSGGIRDFHSEDMSRRDCSKGVRCIVTAGHHQLNIVSLSLRLDGEARAFGLEL